MPPVPAYLAKHIGGMSDPSIYNVTARPRFPSISIGDARFTAIDEEGNEQLLGLKEFEFIVISSNPSNSRTYYATGYDPANPGAPDCYSDNGLFPDIRVARPVHDNCSTCPMSMWGSAKSNLTNKDIKACSDSKKLAIVPFDADGNDLGVHMFRLSPASLPNWTKYVNSLRKDQITDNVSLNPEWVVTKAFWSERKNVMDFKMVDFMQDEELTYAAGLRKAGDFAAWIGTDDQSQAHPQLASQPRRVHQAIAAPVKASEKVIDVEPEEEPKPASRPRRQAAQAAEEPKEESPRRRRLGGGSEFMDEAQPGRAREEMLEAGKTQGQRMSAVELAKQQARAAINNGARSR